MHRLFVSKRMAVTEAIVSVLNQINGTGDYLNNLYNSATSEAKFWDEVNDFPFVSVVAGSEARQYLAGGYKERYLSAIIRIYVKEDNSLLALESLLEDIETALETNNQPQYTDRQGNPQRVKQITINSISTDEGILNPLGIGEMSITIQY